MEILSSGSVHYIIPQIKRPMWVGKIEAVKDGEKMGWKLLGSGRSQGVYDAVVIAHNGKCANR